MSAMGAMGGVPGRCYRCGVELLPGEQFSCDPQFAKACAERAASRNAKADAAMNTGTQIREDADNG